jgi:hypothetical protein
MILPGSIEIWKYQFSEALDVIRVAQFQRRLVVSELLLLHLARGIPRDTNY